MNEKRMGTGFVSILLEQSDGPTFFLELGRRDARTNKL